MSRVLRPRLVRALAGALLSANVSCAERVDDARTATIVSTLTDADQALIASRPALVAGKYARMGRDFYGFYRGSLALFAHDLRAPGAPIATSRFALDQPLVPSIGDPHPENFGVMWAGDGTPALEPNDFDAADRAPYLRDLRRLVAGMAVAATVANADDPTAQAQTRAAARTIARATAQGYADAIISLAGGAAPARITDAQGSAYLADLFARAVKARQKRTELAAGGPTQLVSGARTLVRGAPDPTAPESVQADLPAFAYAALPATLEAYRQTLIAPPDAAYFTVIDAVRVFGSGVASWPKVRAIVLVRGPTDDPGDDVLLEVKELTDSGTAGWWPPGVDYADLPARVRGTSRAAWARPDADPLWGATTWLGIPVQIKSESEAFKTVRTSKMVGSIATADELAKLGAVLGALLARVHATPVLRAPSAAPAIAARIARDRDGFLDEQAAGGTAYAALASDDYMRFRGVLFERGYLLGHVVDEIPPAPSLAALFGTPPPVVPLTP